MPLRSRLSLFACVFSLSLFYREYIINTYPCRVYVKPDLSKKDDSASPCTVKKNLEREDEKKDLSSSSSSTSQHRHLDTATTTGEGEEADEQASSSSASCKEAKACLSLGENEKTTKTSLPGSQKPLILVEEDDGTQQPLLDYLRGSLDNIDWGADYDRSLRDEAFVSAIDLIDEDLLPPLHQTLVPWEAQIDRYVNRAPPLPPPSLRTHAQTAAYSYIHTYVNTCLYIHIDR